jgi:hypothetical protein
VKGQKKKRIFTSLDGCNPSEKSVYKKNENPWKKQIEKYITKE